MPQLNPSPWLFIMITSWLALSLIFQPKTLSFTSTNPPANKTSATTKNHPWTWPWS
uniref:ATP synthase complex subunit 8 n=1 Tax=Ara tricolor TaxID=2049294 RepID=A0A343X9T2_9PSIT|nr:ATP synthase F0 subunit 8 [Ara tricolor]AWH62784.1 ATP synthase F0 subunit 8 [Ara tricolor]AWH62797.1 ATP synthase F0 subunit 8 [Ara tricolor]